MICMKIEFCFTGGWRRQVSQCFRGDFGDMVLTGENVWHLGVFRGSLYVLKMLLFHCEEVEKILTSLRKNWSQTNFNVPTQSDNEALKDRYKICEVTKDGGWCNNALFASLKTPLLAATYFKKWLWRWFTSPSQYNWVFWLGIDLV